MFPRRGAVVAWLQDLLEWKSPLRSLSVMSALLLVAYHDLVRYAIPLALLSNVAYVFGEARGLVWV